jgi:uncharacterized membrane protein
LSKTRSASLKTQNSEARIDEHETDSPLLPVPQLERLAAFRPDRVDWFFEQTEKEADHRRSETVKVNKYIFRERLVGQIFALLIGISGIIGGAVVAVMASPTAGATIASVAIGTLAVVFITGKNTKS